MTRTRATLVALLAALAVPLATAHTLNLLENGGFEDDVDADGVPDFWEATSMGNGGASGCSLAKSTDAYAGNHSLAISAPSGAHGHCGVVSEAIAVTLGVTYEFTVYTKDEGSDLDIGLAGIWFFDASGARLQNTAICQNPEGDWVLAKCTAYPPLGSSTVRAHVDAYVQNGGTVRFDDARLVRT